MFPQNLFIPEEFLVGMKNTPTGRKDFAIPKIYHETDNQYFQALNEWSDFISSVKLINTLRTGFKIDGFVSRETTSNKFFIIQDRGHTFEINCKNLKHIIKNATIINGEIQEQCIWMREEWDFDGVPSGANRLVVEGSQTYNKVIERLDELKATEALISKWGTQNTDETDEGDEMKKKKIMKKVYEIVDMWLDEDDMFTAFDVTLQAKEEGADERHRNMKGYVHERMAYHMGRFVDYERTLIPVVGQEDAWLYHPSDADISEYALQDRDDANTAQPTTVKDNLDGITTNSRNRLIIPVKFLKEVGMYSGDRVYVSVDLDEDTLTVSKSKPKSNDSLLDSYLVDKSNNIMISTNKLSKLGMTADKFTISSKNSELVIEGK